MKFCDIKEDIVIYIQVMPEASNPQHQSSMHLHLAGTRSERDK